MTWEDFRLSTRLNLQAEVVEPVYALLAEIDAVKNSWRITGQLLPQTIERLTRSVIITSTGASNRIEGNRLSDQEVEALYRNLRIKKFKTRDEQEVAGYIEMLSLVFKNFQDIPISESSVLKLHHDMLRYSDKDAGYKGQYKVGPNRVEAKDAQGNVVGIIFDPTPPYLVKKEIQELLDWYNWALGARLRHPLILIANFVFEYLAIHPFQDGNGRTSRLLTNLMLLQQGYAFTSLVSHEKVIESQKADYYLALNRTQRTWKSDKEDISPWLLFFLQVLKAQADSALMLLGADTIEDLLSPSQRAVWQWAQGQGEFGRKDVVAALGLPERTAESALKKLLEMNQLQRLGQGRATRYRVK